MDAVQGQLVTLMEQYLRSKQEISPVGLSLSRQQSENASTEKDVRKKRSKRIRSTLSRSKSLN